MEKEATEALPAKQLEIDNHHFRLRGYAPSSLLDARQRQPSTESYEANIQTGMILGSTKTDVQISMPQLPCKRSSRDLVPYVERDVVRVHHKHCRKRSKGRKFSSTWSISSLHGSLKIN
jgi:hypothetical protein